MGGCATKENKENKPADEADGCVLLWPAFSSNVRFQISYISTVIFADITFYLFFTLP